MAKKKITRKRPDAQPPQDPSKDYRDDIDRIMDDYDQGNRIQLFHALVRCRQYGIAPNDRILSEIEKGWRRYINAKTRTLDEAFGVERPKGFHVTAEEDRVDKAFRVYLHIDRERKDGASLTNELYELVGRKFGVSGSTARRYFEDVKRTLTV